MCKTKPGTLSGDLRSSNAHKEIEHLQRGRATSVVFDISNRDVWTQHPGEQVEHETVILGHWLLQKVPWHFHTPRIGISEHRCCDHGGAQRGMTRGGLESKDLETGKGRNSRAKN